MKKNWIFSLVFLILMGVGAFAAYRFWPGIKPVVLPPPSVDMPLQLPDGFSIEIFADGIPNARAMRFDERGNMWVSATRSNTVWLLEIENGAVVRKTPMFQNLQRPHGLAFDPKNPFTLYIAEEHQIVRTCVYCDDSSPEKIIDLPPSGRHFTRTLGFGPDNKLYISIGSSCDVCEEPDPRYAAIYKMNRDGSEFELVADGLRNAVFFTWHPKTDALWATEMGRDRLGDDLPPDEVNIIEAGKNYGWPICYGKQIHDTNFDKNQYIRDPCEDTEPSHIDLQAHSAPLGLAFIPNSDDVLIAYHGSWNRTVPTGYKIVRAELDAAGNFIRMHDFITGWLTEDNRALGRPVDLIFHEGALYISDDKAGLLYKVSFPAA